MIPLPRDVDDLEQQIKALLRRMSDSSSDDDDFIIVGEKRVVPSFEMVMRRIDSGNTEEYPLPRDFNLYSWVDREALGTVCMIDSAEHVEECNRTLMLTHGGAKDDEYEVVAPSREERVCSLRTTEAEPHYMMMYLDLFIQIGVCLPFSEFQTSILMQIRVAPSQLHPSSWGFVRLFELVCDALGIPLYKKVFFYLFFMMRPDGAGSTMGWISFRSRDGRKFCEVYEQSFKDFKYT